MCERFSSRQVKLCRIFGIGLFEVRSSVLVDKIWVGNYINFLIKNRNGKDIWYNFLNYFVLDERLTYRDDRFVVEEGKISGKREKRRRRGKIETTVIRGVVYSRVWRERNFYCMRVKKITIRNTTNHIMPKCTLSTDFVRLLLKSLSKFIPELFFHHVVSLLLSSPYNSEFFRLFLRFLNGQLFPNKVKENSSLNLD